MSIIKELSDYREFTSPAELHKAVNILRGMVVGIASDNTATEQEFLELVNWCKLHSHLSNKHPFNELLPVLDEVLEDNIITEDEIKDILWVCDSFSSESEYYDFITSSLQYLQGIIHGIMADSFISDDEVFTLEEWVDNNDYLKGCYPYDEIESILLMILKDKKVDNAERELLTAFLSNFVDEKASYNLNSIELQKLRKKYNIAGICSVDPCIEFQGNIFCFTGKSNKTSRNGIAKIITEKGGIYNDRIVNDTKYLIVGNDGNPCWAFACYGRKIEEAVSMRKRGKNIVIVNEVDFWDTIG